MGIQLPGFALVLLALICTIPICMAVGYTMELVAYRPLRRAPRLAPLITAIGLSIVLQQVAVILWGTSNVKFPAVLDHTPINNMGAVVTKIQILIVVLCFAIMIGVYYDGQPLCAGIMDVMNNALYWGGMETGVYCNDTKLNPAVDLPLKEGLVGVSWRQFLKNAFEEIRIARSSAGIRVMGSAGLEFVEVITGKHIAYLATLNPWDIAAGNVLVQALGYRISNVSGNPISLKKVNHIMVANPQTYRDIRKIQAY